MSIENAEKIGGDWFDHIADNLFKCQIIDARDVERVARIYRKAAAEHESAEIECCRATTDKYTELIFAVETVHDGETRHQTALRYIREREVHSSDVAQEAKKQT